MQNNYTVCITGGCGYIGSSIAHALAKQNIFVVVLDNYDIAGDIQQHKMLPSTAIFHHIAIESPAVYDILSQYPNIQTVIHCAAFIQVPESIAKPSKYYTNNVANTLLFLQTLERLDRNWSIVFSSSASVYASPTKHLPTLLSTTHSHTAPSYPIQYFGCDETAPTQPTNPYAMSKLLVEQILRDFVKHKPWRALSFRYFNPIGSDAKGLYGPYLQHPSSILGLLLQVAHKKQEYFYITGHTYPTPDGSGIRDYIDIQDLAAAHVLGMQWLQKQPPHLYEVMNLGTAQGTSVWQLLAAFEQALGRPIPYKISPPRPGDMDGIFAIATKANTVLDWQPVVPMAQSLTNVLAWMANRDHILG
jgi:UDP-glucose 4-epimerase